MAHNYDWPYIRMRYEAGETAYAISQAMGWKPTKQAIMKRAAKEGWERAEPSDDDELPERLPIVAQALSIRSHKLTDELLRVVLGMIGVGATEALACQAAGINQTTWIDWKHQDPKLKDAVHRARAGKLSEWIGRIDQASQKDWKAAQTLLQAAPETREHFGKDQQGSKLEVVIHIDRDAPGTEHVRGVTIEGEAEPKDDEAA